MTVETMRRVSEHLLQQIREMKPGEFLERVPLKDYHGFPKGRLPEEMLLPALADFGLTPEQVQAELVLVNGDHRSKVHRHREAYAACTMLGEREHLPNPVGIEAYLNDRWFPANAGDEIDFPPDSWHGFSANEEQKGFGYFLSVQSPPIERPGGHDDFELPE